MLAAAKSYDVAVERHLETACARPAGRGKGQLSCVSQAEVAVPERVGDPAEELESVEDERPAVGEEATSDLDLHVEVWSRRVAAVAEPSEHLATANVLSDADTN